MAVPAQGSPCPGLCLPPPACTTSPGFPQPSLEAHELRLVEAFSRMNTFISLLEIKRKLTAVVLPWLTSPGLLCPPSLPQQPGSHKLLFPGQALPLWTWSHYKTTFSKSLWRHQAPATLSSIFFFCSAQQIPPPLQIHDLIQSQRLQQKQTETNQGMMALHPSARIWAIPSWVCLCSPCGWFVARGGGTGHGCCKCRATASQIAAQGIKAKWHLQRAGLTAFVWCSRRLRSSWQLFGKEWLFLSLPEEQILGE